MKKNITISVNGEFPDQFVAYLKACLGGEPTTVFMPSKVEIVQFIESLPKKFVPPTPLDDFYAAHEGLDLSFESMLNSPMGTVFLDKDEDYWYSYGDGTVCQSYDLSKSYLESNKFKENYYKSYGPWSLVEADKWKHKPDWIADLEKWEEAGYGDLTLEEIRALPAGTIIVNLAGKQNCMYGHGVRSYNTLRTFDWAFARPSMSESDVLHYGPWRVIEEKFIPHESFSEKAVPDEIWFSDLQHLAPGTIIKNVTGQKYEVPSDKPLTFASTVNLDYGQSFHAYRPWLVSDNSPAETASPTPF